MSDESSAQTASRPSDDSSKGTAAGYPFLFRFTHWLLTGSIIILILTGFSMHAGSRPDWSLLNGKVPWWLWNGRVHYWHTWAALVFTPALVAACWVYVRRRVYFRPTHVILLVGGLFLVARKIITWHIPVSFLGTMALFAAITNGADDSAYAGVVFHLFTGGAIIGAFFMATDYVTSPMYPMGKLIFGAGCGILTMVIRLWAGYPEGVSFAVLLMNAAVPIIDMYTKPKKFGMERFAEAGEGN